MIRIMLDDGAFIPKKAHDDDAGYDLFSRDDVVLRPGEAYVFDTGVHAEIKPGWFGKIESKSGLMTRNRIVSPGGVIDSGYTGSIKVMLENRGNIPYMVERKDKIAQLILMRCGRERLKIVDSLDKTERGDNGFGSSGR